MQAEILDITPRLIEHWQTHLESAEKMREQAIKNLTRLAIAASGQLVFDFEEPACA